jgi:hypothetical protein
MTSSRSSLKRQDFGRRTAWLPPFWKILARSPMSSKYIRISILIEPASLGAPLIG